MDYEKKYKETLSKAKDMLSYKEVRCDDTEYLFPELKESEDEKIRKSLIELIKEYASLHYITKTQYSEMMTWLEKQGKHINFLSKIQVGDKVTRNEDGVLVNTSQLKRVAKSRFNVGDWVVKGDVVAQILDVTQEQYYIGTDTNGNDFVSSKFLSKNKIHLWTLADAKDGDILVTPNQNIFIFKGIKNTTVYDYCGVYFNKFKEGSSSVNGIFDTELPTNYVPATKNQRDFLFLKMKEAGYKWDADKRLPIKIVKF